ncbi:MAG TPA: DUF1329 domain-containing protein [Candidatus Binataceae bacterium]|nr:DUF1329 domain-containing protein [Candidatus Binataceae bacterium]
MWEDSEISRSRLRAFEMWRAGWVGYAMLAVLVSAGALLAAAAPAAAQGAPGYSRQTVDQWLAGNANAKPDFKPGDVLTAKDLERIRSFIVPGYIDQLNFPELKMEIVAPRSHRPRKDFMQCTEKYQAQVKLKSDGTLDNYLCGQPFPNEALRPGDPQSGYKAIWNFEHRWQNYGPLDLNFMFVYDTFGGDHNGAAPGAIESPPDTWTGGRHFKSKMPTDASRFFGGGGTFVKTLSSFYQRVYYSHLAQREAEGGLAPVPDAKDYFWKEFEGFFAPYDMRGQVFITYRYNDPYRSDDAWAYDPSLRRVRRISVEVKSDSLVGTDQTEEDFNTFSGRPVRWNWKFLGWRNLLCVMDSKYDYPRFFGPNGDVPDDAWSMRRFAVVERTPKEPHHPYSSVVMFWDAEDWHPWMAVMFDRQQSLWKSLTYTYRWSEDYKDWAEINHGVEAAGLQGLVAIDYHNRRATIFPAFGGGYPEIDPKRVEKLFDINKLEELHR